jgi:A/G-specific adenine glycosylase
VPATKDIAAPLLAWYDRAHRRLPWRVPPGSTEKADPYRVWLSEIMLQQTTVAAVQPYFERFLARWPTVEALAAADDADVLSAWAGLGYYARARNLLACARAVAGDHGGAFPETEKALRALPGIGGYTAAAIAAIGFGQPAVVVDGNVERVVARLFAVEEPLPRAKPALHALPASIAPAERPGDFAQAMMDLGAGVCRPRAPDCPLCPLAELCDARALGIAEALPRREPKSARPERHGRTYWIERDDSVLLVRRPAKGLLGGMLALPASAFADAPSAGHDGAPEAAIIGAHAGTVRHVFTHFKLQLEVYLGELPYGAEVEGVWTPLEALSGSGFPTLFRKAADIALRRTARGS